MHPNLQNSSITTLTRKWCDAQLDQHSTWLARLDKDPTQLQAAIVQQKRFRLGKYFEDLVLFWITESPHFEHIANGLQIISEGKTIGEADLLLKSKAEQRTEHWELAVKYYLCEDASNEWQQWIGPNPADTLQQKMRTLIDKQLKLFENTVARNILTDLNVETVAPCLFLKGYFFSEFSLGKVMRPDQAAQPLNGWWCKISDFEALARSSEHWALLEKEWWLAPVLTDGKELPIYNATEIVQVISRVAAQGKSVLCAPLQQKDELFAELFKLFVVPERWPAQ